MFDEFARPAKVTHHTQVTLARENATRHTWLPSQYAVVGSVVDLREKDGTWTADWKVTEVFDTTVTSLAERFAKQDIRTAGHGGINWQGRD